MSFKEKLKNLFRRDLRRSTARTGGGQISALLIYYSVAIVILIILMFAIFSYASIKLRQSDAYVALANEQQIISQQLASFSLDAAIGNSAAFLQLRRFQARFVQTLNGLKSGVPESGLPPLPDDLLVDLQTVESRWLEYNRKIESIISSRESIEQVGQFVTLINESIPELLVQAESVVDILVKTKAGRKDIAIAAKQMELIQSVQNSLNQIMSGGDVVMSAADRFGKETGQIEQNLIAMLEGNADLGISQLTGDEVVNRLLQMADLFSVVKKNVNQILQNSPQLFEVREAADDIQLLAPNMLSASQDLVVSIAEYNKRYDSFNYLAYASGVIAVVLLLFLGYSLIRESNRRLEDSQQQNERNQRAILRLLDEMANLADGDLTTHTTVTEDITGAIADSVNYSIDALRDLVVSINDTSEKVNAQVKHTRDSAIDLAASSEQQAKEIEQASNAVTDISVSINQVSKNASDSADVARNSVSIAHNGAETVRKTITGMESIREQIQETSKRIKRLGESSQEIGDIVNLITEISDQTNILALNAAIQAAMAGEAGRGFAVVADEVQRLAERTGDATRQIEALVKTIQADTNEAISSMEQSTSNVVDGARLAEDAGGALEKIEKVSTNLAQRILQISDSTRDQAQNSESISANMSEIQSITLKTSAGSTEVADAIGTLAASMRELHTSVAGFKLPGVDLSDSTIIQSPGDVSEIVFGSGQA